MDKFKSDDIYEERGNMKKHGMKINENETKVTTIRGRGSTDTNIWDTYIRDRNRASGNFLMS